MDLDALEREIMGVRVKDERGHWFKVNGVMSHCGSGGPFIGLWDYTNQITLHVTLDRYDELIQITDKALTH